MNENISAISTALGVGGVSIIRISGDTPLEIAKKMFKPLSNKQNFEFVPYVMYPGEIDGGNFKDFGMCVYFKAPRSFTGENMVELHCHGGLAITQGVLRKTFELGARPATNGEFSKRAFMNGKMSLSSCEGLIDMINSQSVSEVKAGYYLYREKLTKTIHEYQDKLTYLLAKIHANIDYPEEGLEGYELSEIETSLTEVNNCIKNLISKYSTGRKIKHGVKVALLGKPNTGKSSVLNALLNYDKAIVSDIAGTTRDIVDGEIDINGIRFNLYDTAGIHESQNQIEKIGIERSFKMLDDSDLAIVMLDNNSVLDDYDENILKAIKDKNFIIALNKTDLDRKNDHTFDIEISAKTGKNIEQLKTLMYNKTIGENIDFNGDMLTEERHLVALKSANESLETAINGVYMLSSDLLSIDIKNAWDSLGEISGDTQNEDIITEIFSKFCVGK